MVKVSNYENKRNLRLQELLAQVKQVKNDTQRNAIAINIVAIILRSRPLCHHFNGMLPTGIYGEIYNLAKQTLLQKVQQALIKINEQQQSTPNSPLATIITPEELYALQTQVFQEIIDNEQLKKLAQSAKKFAPNSDLRSYALTELIRAIKLSNKLCRPHSHKFSDNLYQMIYEEALTETLAYICLNIDSYDPERGNKKFMNWVNFKLDKLILQCYAKYRQFTEYNFPSLQDIEQIKAPAASVNLSAILYQYIQQDPGKTFQKTHIRNRPDANFRYLALEKFSQKSWEEIADELKIPIPTLSGFYNRWCRRFQSILEEELQKYI